MKSIHFFAVIMILILSTGCGDRRSGPPQAPKKPAGEDSAEVSLNHSPTHRLVLKKTFSLAADTEKDQYFSRSRRDEEGHLYLANPETAEIMKFDSGGTFLLAFGGKGEGPGEFQYIKSFAPFEKEVVVWGGRKFASFSLEGKLLKEKKVRKYYYPVAIVTPDRFLVKFFDESGPEDDIRRERVIALIDGEENILTTYYREEGLGSTIIRKKNFVFSFSSSAITPDIGFFFHRPEGRIGFYRSMKYRVEIRNLEGKILQTIQRPWKNRKIREEDGEKIIGMFRNISPDQEEMILKNLPGELCALTGVRIFPSGHLLVMTLKGVEEYEMHLYTPGGTFLGILEYPEDFNLRGLRIFQRKVAGIRETPEGDVYEEYEIMNYDSIFR